MEFYVTTTAAVRRSIRRAPDDEPPAGVTVLESSKKEPSLIGKRCAAQISKSKLVAVAAPTCEFEFDALAS